MPDPGAARHDARILILDDEAANVEFLRHVLEPEGYASILEFTDAEEALAAFRGMRPDLVVLDLMMPGCDGFQFMERVRDLLRDDEVLPILVATADTSTEVRRRALSVGARDFLTKPLSPADVRLRVRNLLDTRLLHEELRRHNEHLEHRVGERTAELELARIEILARLARAAEYRDDDTGHHTQRVGRTAARLGEILGLPPARVEVIRRAAPLHDVGKIGIPDAILLKAGPLSNEEREMMQRHAQIGADILGGSDVPLLRLAEEIALAHHERWDGNGYPEGLSGEDIPQSGRLVAVADVFDSLTHERPYKGAWTVRDALAEIQDCAGSQFDPAVVEALLRIAPEITVAENVSRPEGGRDATSGRGSLKVVMPDPMAARVEELEAERGRLARELENTRRKLARRDKTIESLRAARARAGS